MQATTTASQLLQNVLSSLQENGKSYEGHTYSLSTSNTFPANWILQSGPKDAGTSSLLNAILEAFKVVQNEPYKKHYIDILQLANRRMDDAFQVKMIQGLIDIADSVDTDVVIRYLEGSPSGQSSDDRFTFIETLKSMLGTSTTSTTIYAASLDYPWAEVIENITPGSWNHAKIIAIDGVTSFVGGQNYWNDYLGESPPHDLTISVTGDSTIAAHNFSNFLWNYVADPIGANTVHKALKLDCDAEYTEELPPQFDASNFPSSSSTSEMPILAVGNLGIWGSTEAGLLVSEIPDALLNQVSPQNTSTKLESAYNPQLWFPFFELDKITSSQAMQASTAARHLLLQQVENDGYLRISQQKIANTDIIDTNPASNMVLWPGEFLQAIVEALTTKGANVDIVVSNHSPGSGYNDDMGGLALRGVILDLVAKAMDTTVEAIPDSIKEKLNVRSTGQNSNHAKVWIVDSKVFYVGSDNIYPGYLQEFGYIVGNESQAQEFITGYWEPLWELAVEPH